MYSECRHIMPSGKKCHAAALRGTAYCYFHTRVHHYAKAKPEPKNAPLKLPVLEDRIGRVKSRLAKPAVYFVELNPLAANLDLSIQPS